MLEIKNTELFHHIIKTSLDKAKNFPRWVSAINKAVVQISLHGEFMHYDETENYLVIWSQGSDKVYSANGACQCRSHTQLNNRGEMSKRPCWHKAAARLVRLYLELPENKNPQFPNEQTISARLREQSAKCQRCGQTFDYIPEHLAGGFPKNCNDCYGKSKQTISERLAEQNNAPYLKATPANKVERIGGVRI